MKNAPKSETIQLVAVLAVVATTSQPVFPSQALAQEHITPILTSVSKKQLLNFNEDPIRRCLSDYRRNITQLGDCTYSGIRFNLHIAEFGDGKSVLIGFNRDPEEKFSFVVKVKLDDNGFYKHYGWVNGKRSEVPDIPNGTISYYGYPIDGKGPGIDVLGMNIKKYPTFARKAELVLRALVFNRVFIAWEPDQETDGGTTLDPNTYLPKGDYKIKFPQKPTPKPIVIDPKERQKQILEGKIYKMLNRNMVKAHDKSIIGNRLAQGDNVYFLNRTDPENPLSQIYILGSEKGKRYLFTQVPNGEIIFTVQQFQPNGEYKNLSGDSETTFDGHFENIARRVMDGFMEKYK
jgi:hypothetical protein